MVVWCREREEGRDSSLSRGYQEHVSYFLNLKDVIFNYVYMSVLMWVCVRECRACRE